MSQVTSLKTASKRSIGGFLALILLLVLSRTAQAGILMSLTLEPPIVTGGYPATGTVKWVPCKFEPGCPEVEVVTLSSSNTAVATVPQQIYIDPLQESESFEITTQPVLTPKSVTITATKNGVSRTVTLTVCPMNPRLISFTASSTQVLGGLPVDATIGLDCVAPPDGLPINLTSSDPAVAWVPASVIIPFGETSHAFTELVRTFPVTSPKSVEISASSNGISLTVNLLVKPGLNNLNLSINRIEVTQAIQCLDAGICPDNVLPLVKNKITALRVYLQAQGTNLEIGPVRAKLSSRPCGTSGEWIDHPPVWATARIDPNMPLLEQRKSPMSPGAAAYNLTFLVDRVYLESGCLNFRAEVNPDHTIVETDYTDNTLNLSDIRFQATGNLNIKFVQIDYCPNCPFSHDPHYKPSWATIDSILSYLRKVYPVDQVNYWKASKEVNVVYTTWFKDFSKEATWQWVLTKLALIATFTTGDPENVHYYGLLDERVPHGDIAGWGWSNPRMAAGIAGDGPIAAHEIGHNLKRLHAPCDDPPDVDPNWPDSTNPNAIIGQTGFDVDRGLPLPGDTYHDFMSYCDHEWISPYTYEALFEIATLTPLDRSATALESRQRADMTDYLIVSGIVQANGEVFLNDFYHQTFPAGSHDFVGSGAYSIVIRAAGGQTLFTRRFDFQSAHGHLEPGAFFEIVPSDPQITRIDIGVQGATGFAPLASRDVSAHVPTVQMRFPNGGESMSATEPFTVTWVASDADGDSLSYLVLYSRDAGATWEALGSDMRETSYPLDASQLAGTNQALIRVIASDGVNTSQDDTDAAFVIEKKNPEVMILNPAESTQLEPGTSVVLRGTAADAEDGSLPDESLIWTSNRDGPLGSGSEIVADLSSGIHTVTLTAHDADGNFSSDTIEVIVQYPYRLYLPLILK